MLQSLSDWCFRPNCRVRCERFMVDTSRQEEEVAILKMLAGIPGIPSVVDHCTVAIGGAPDTTARFRMLLVVQLNINGKVTYSCRDSNNKPLEICEHRRIVIGPYTNKIENFPSLPDFVAILADITKSKCRHARLVKIANHIFSAYSNLGYLQEGLYPLRHQFAQYSLAQCRWSSTGSSYRLRLRSPSRSIFY